MSERDERARIIDAAYRCLADSNGATASVADILAVAGLSTRAFYRHFDSKDDLLIAMFRRDNERVTQERDGELDRAGSPTDALHRFIHGTLRLTAEKRRRQRVLLMTSEEARRARGYLREKARAASAQESTLNRILEDGLRDGSFPRVSHPAGDARAIRAILEQAFEDQISGTSSVSPSKAADYVVGFALRAVGVVDASGSAPSRTADARARG